MKKRLLTLLLCLFLLCPSALAHGGKTDANGGHYDRSTGEYHYHHGYPAHQHYDMDGDGIIDCPYDFDDQTDHSSHGGSSGSSSQPRYDTVDPSLPVIQNDEKKTVDYNLVVAIIVCSIVLISTTVISIRVVKNKKEAERQRLEQKRKQAERERKAHAEYLQKEMERLRLETEQELEYQRQKARFSKLYSGKTLEALSLAPINSTVNKEGLPVNIGISCTEEWGPDYTVYVTESGKAYHRYPRCRCVIQIPLNIYVAKKRAYHPCAFCQPPAPDLSWVETFIHIRDIKRTYGIDTEERAVKPRSAADGRIFICERDR